MTGIRVMLATITLPVTLAAVLLAAQGAQASTPGCVSGAYFGYCATQEDNGSPVLVMDSAHQQTTLDNAVIGWSDSTSDPATDWFQLPYAGNNLLGVMFVFAPKGRISNKCASDPGDGRVVLRECNGSDWQRWISAEVGSTGFYTWTNLATHRILQAGAMGSQLVTVSPSATISANQEWKFST
jgi:hypothetical protein